MRDALVSRAHRYGASSEIFLAIARPAMLAKLLVLVTMLMPAAPFLH